MYSFSFSCVKLELLILVLDQFLILTICFIKSADVNSETENLFNSPRFVQSFLSGEKVIGNYVSFFHVFQFPCFLYLDF